MKALVCEKASFKDAEGKDVYMVVLATKDARGNVHVMKKQGKDGKQNVVKFTVVPSVVYDKVFPCKVYDFKMGLIEGSMTASVTGVTESDVSTL